MAGSWHYHCFNSYVQKIVYPFRPPCPSPSVGILSIFIAVLILAAPSSRAGEPKTVSEARPQISLTQLACVTQSFYLVLPDNPSEAVATNSQGAEPLLPANQVDFQANSIRGEPVLVVRDQPGVDKPSLLEAGFGKIWDENSVLQKICADYQHPGYAYVQAHFSF